MTDRGAGLSEATVKREVTVYPAFSTTRSLAQQNPVVNFGSAHCKALGILTGEAAQSSHPVPEHSRAFRRLSQLGKSPELSAFFFLAISSSRLRSTTIAMAASPAAFGSSTSGSSGEALPPSSSWQKCSLQESDIQDLVEHGLLPEKQISGWRCCYGEDFPSEDTN